MCQLCYLSLDKCRYSTNKWVKLKTPLLVVKLILQSDPWSDFLPSCNKCINPWWVPFSNNRKKKDIGGEMIYPDATNVINPFLQWCDPIVPYSMLRTCNKYMFFLMTLNKNIIKSLYWWVTKNVCTLFLTFLLLTKRYLVTESTGQK